MDSTSSNNVNGNNIMAPPPSVVTSTLLETYIPASLALAAAICWIDPKKFPAVFFAFCGLGFLFREPLMGIMMHPVTVQISESITKTTEEIFHNQERLDRILSAGTIALDRALLGSSPLRNTLKMAIVESIQDDDFANVILTSTTKAIVKASKDDSLLEALTVVAKQGLLEALRDKEFIKETVTLLVEAILSATKDPQMKDLCMGIVTESVQTALQDEKFISILRGVVKDTLRDGDMYRAGVSGFVGAFMPGGSSKK